ncbi:MULTISPECIES: hypothetical protein [unclassified Pseudomonas]
MQTPDENSIATPETWCPGLPVIVPPPKTAEAAENRAAEGYDTIDWHYST